MKDDLQICKVNLQRYLIVNLIQIEPRYIALACFLQLRRQLPRWAVGDSMYVGSVHPYPN